MGFWDNADQSKKIFEGQKAKINRKILGKKLIEKQKATQLTLKKLHINF